MELMGVAVLGLAVARLTRLVTTDKIMEPFRFWAARKLGADSFWLFGLHCMWCVSMYTGALLAAGYVLAGHSPWYQIPALALAASYLAGVLDRLTDGE
jgi:hypothetical protein